MSRHAAEWLLGLLMVAALVIAFGLMFVGKVGAIDTELCEAEPASQWAPAGFICPPIYGSGVASRWPGPGVARNDCTYPWTDCPPIQITSHATGRSIIVIPSMWCMCWIGAHGPDGETARIVDLDPAAVEALGLDWERGLYEVTVEPASIVLLPDTAMNHEVTP